jgi:hypothetical protein
MKVIWIDATTPILAKRVGDAAENIYYRYSRHWTPESHRVVAEMLHQKIRVIRTVRNALGRNQSIQQKRTFSF